MSQAERDKEIQLKVRDIVKEEGALLIDFKVFFSSGKYLLRCLIDYPQGGITLHTCAAINKRIFSYLDESNILGDDYTVEVNSPGLDRPLKEASDFLRAKGRIISLWLKEPVCQKSYLEAEVVGIKGNKLSLLYKEKPLEINLNKIKFAKERLK